MVITILRHKSEAADLKNATIRGIYGLRFVDSVTTTHRLLLKYAYCAPWLRITIISVWEDDQNTWKLNTVHMFKWKYIGTANLTVTRETTMADLDKMTIEAFNRHYISEGNPMSWTFLPNSAIKMADVWIYTSPSIRETIMLDKTTIEKNPSRKNCLGDHRKFGRC